MSYRLSGRTRKATLALHIISAVGWLGIDVVLGFFVLMTKFSDDPATVAVSYQAMRIFGAWTLLPAGLLCLVTGVVLGLGSRYGVFRHWWVTVKLAVNLILTMLVPIGLLPLLDDAAGYGRQLAAGHLTLAPPDALIYPPIVSPLALIGAVVLAIYKPWGRIRGDRQKR